MARLATILIAGMILAMTGMAPSRADQPIVVTLPALGFLVQLVDPTADIIVLIDGDEDAHHASLTPYERMSLSRAKLIVSAGGLEGGMADALSDPALADKRLDLGGGHFWFDLARVSEVVRKIAFELDGDRKATYDLSIRLDQQLRAKLAAVAGQGVVVLHGGLEPFMDRYGLKVLYEVAADHEAGLGASDMAQISEQLDGQDRACVVGDLHTPQASLDAIIGDRTDRVRSFPFDFIGGRYQAYDEMMLSLADKLSACLQD